MHLSEEELETISKELDSIMKMNHNLQNVVMKLEFQNYSTFIQICF